MRAWPGGFSTAMQAADPMRPLLLLTIFTGLGAPNDVLRYCNSDAPVVFPDGANTYLPRAFSVGQIRMEGQSASGNVSLEVADPDEVILALVNAGARFQDRDVELRMVERSKFDNAANTNAEAFIVAQEPDWEGHTFRFSLTALDAFLSEVFPVGVFTRDRFPGIPERE